MASFLCGGGRTRPQKTLLPTFALGALFAGHLAACTVFDGLSVPAETGAPSGSGPSGGDPAGTGGTGGMTGASSGSTTSSSGMGGGGGIGGAPVASTTYLSVDQAAVVCSYAFSCNNLAASVALSLGVPIDDANFSQCMTWLAGPLPENRIGLEEQKAMLACVAAAGTCAEAGACLPYEKISAGVEPCSSSQSQCVDSATAADCSSMVVSHCSNAGFAAQSQCAEMGSEAACIKESCDTPGMTSCEGGYLLTCSAGGFTRSLCAVAGLPCIGQGGSAACGMAASCGAAGQSACNGGVVEVCTGEAVSPFDCGAIGASCVAEMAGRARCELPGASCMPWDPDVNVCSSNNKDITVCVGGQSVKVKCPSGKCLGANGVAYCG